MARTTPVTAQPTHKLRDVVLNEISFVGAGDNPEAHIMLLKIKKEGSSVVSLGKGYTDEKSEALTKWLGDNEKLLPSTIQKDDAQTFDQIIENRKIRGKIWDLVWTLEDSISSIVNDESVTDKAAMITQSVSQFTDAITAITKEEVPMPHKQLEAQVATLTKEKEDLTAENATLKAKTAKPAVGETCATCGSVHKEAEPATIDKSKLDPAVRAILEKAEANDVELRKMRDNDLTRTYIGKAADCANVGKVDEIGTLLKSIATHDSALADKVLDVFKTADARIKAGGLLEEVGKDAKGTGASAADKIDALAKEALEKNPALGTIQKAWVHVYDSNDELRKEFIAQRK